MKTVSFKCFWPTEQYLKFFSLICHLKSLILAFILFFYIENSGIYGMAGQAHALGTTERYWQ